MLPRQLNCTVKSGTTGVGYADGRLKPVLMQQDVGPANHRSRVQAPSAQPVCPLDACRTGSSMICCARLVAALLTCLPVVALGRWFSPGFDTSLLNPCESPSLPAGAFHIIIAGYERKNCFTSALWDLGLTNARVFVYRRVASEAPLSMWQGPCGMVVHERLLLPNRGTEFAAFHDHIVEFYHNPPRAVLLMHGHGPQKAAGLAPHDDHSSCLTVVGRSRLFYRGLAASSSATNHATVPSAVNASAPAVQNSNDADDARNFARHMVTLTRPAQPGDAHPLSLEIHWDAVNSPQTRRLQEFRQEKADAYNASCWAFLEEWSVNTAGGGFYSCCASFIVPWDQIALYPLLFYQAALQRAQALVDWEDEYYYGRYCWEYLVYTWFREPALTPRMKRLYLKAHELGQRYDLQRCTLPTKNC